MIYRFEKELSQTWFTEIEADSFEEAKELVKKTPKSQWDADCEDDYLTSSRCLQFEDEDAAADGDDYEELEWEP